jgi:hypothetical protein
MARLTEFHRQHARALTLECVASPCHSSSETTPVYGPPRPLRVVGPRQVMCQVDRVNSRGRPIAPARRTRRPPSAQPPLRTRMLVLQLAKLRVEYFAKTLLPLLAALAHKTEPHAFVPESLPSVEPPLSPARCSASSSIPLPSTFSYASP